MIGNLFNNAISVPYTEQKEKTMRKTARALYTCIFIGALIQNTGAWTFGCLQDWHNGDGAIKGPQSGINEGQAAVLQIMKDEKCEFVLFPGDMVEGFWLTDAVKARYSPYSSLEDLVLRVGKDAYGDFLRKPAAYGLKAIGGMGDHEVGDNSAPAGTEHAQAVPYFKKAFAREFTLDANGATLYGGTIGGVPARPVGTPYENTSYAFVQNNVLVISPDVAYFEGPNTAIPGSLDGTLEWQVLGSHAAWFDSVCAAGRRTAGIDFIVVQAHCPVLSPICKQSTSTRYVRGRDTSVFWKIMRKHNVDVYLAGEVHAFSSNIDTVSKTIQLVGGWSPNLTNRYPTLFLFDVAGKTMTISLYEIVNQTYKVTGTMVIDKQGAEKKITSNGPITPIDKAGILLHYTFDQPDASQPFLCTGQFSRKEFPGPATNISIVPGILGQAASFSSSGPSYIRSFEQNPLDKDMARSFSVWVKTTSTAQGAIAMTGSGDGNATFSMYVNNGVLQAMAEGNTIQAASTVPKINDGQWHFVTVTYAGNGAKLESSQFYIDGAPVASAPATKSTTVASSLWGYVCIGTQNGSGGASPYTGVIDDWGAWCSALPAANIKALYNSIVTSDLKYNAAEMDSVFHIYRIKSQGAVAGKTWSYAQGLTGSAGSITKNGAGAYSIVLNGSGEGVTTGAVAVLGNGVRSDNGKSAFSVRRMADGYRLECLHPASGRYTMRLFGANGQCLQKFSAKASGKQISLALERGRRLLPGTYVVSIETERETSLVRFVKM
jgi:hypothetical protein